MLTSRSISHDNLNALDQRLYLQNMLKRTRTSELTTNTQQANLHRCKTFQGWSGGAKTNYRFSRIPTNDAVFKIRCSILVHGCSPPDRIAHMPFSGVQVSFDLNIFSIIQTFHFLLIIYLLFG